MTLKEIKQNKPDGWTLMDAYFLEIKHGLMGFFPIINKDTKKPVVTLEIESLRKIWESLPPRKVNVGKISMMVNKEERLAVDVSESSGDESSSDDTFLILDDVEKYIKEKKLDYASGCISMVDESDEKFPE